MLSSKSTEIELRRHRADRARTRAARDSSARAPRPRDDHAASVTHDASRATTTRGRRSDAPRCAASAAASRRANEPNSARSRFSSSSTRCVARAREGSGTMRDPVDVDHIATCRSRPSRSLDPRHHLRAPTLALRAFIRRFRASPCARFGAHVRARRRRLRTYGCLHRCAAARPHRTRRRDARGLTLRRMAESPRARAHILRALKRRRCVRFAKTRTINRSGTDSFRRLRWSSARPDALSTTCFVRRREMWLKRSRWTTPAPSSTDRSRLNAGENARGGRKCPRRAKMPASTKAIKRARKLKKLI